MKKLHVTKTEWLLLGLTAVFLCGLLALSWQDRTDGPGVTVETAVTASQDEVVPERPLVDLNTAPAEELAELPGIGEALAARIVAYRAENGPFETPEDLMKVSGIGEKKLEDIRDRVTVSGRTGDEE